MVLERIDFELEKPTTEGIYLIEAVSTHQLPFTRRPHRFEARLTITEKEDGLKYTWDISNQRVVAWFRENNMSPQP